VIAVTLHHAARTFVDAFVTAVMLITFSAMLKSTQMDSTI
jgi:hypothetical protein